MCSQEALLQEFDVDEIDVDASTQYFLKTEDEEVVEAVTKFRKLYADFGGNVELELPSDLDENKMCAALEDYSAARDEAHSAVMSEVQSSSGMLTEVQQNRLKKLEDDLLDSALKKHGLTQAVWQTAVQVFLGTSQKFKSKFEEDEQEAKQKILQFQEDNQ